MATDDDEESIFTEEVERIFQRFLPRWEKAIGRKLAPNIHDLMRLHIRGIVDWLELAGYRDSRAARMFGARRTMKLTGQNVEQLLVIAIGTLDAILEIDSE